MAVIVTKSKNTKSPFTVRASNGKEKSFATMPEAEAYLAKIDKVEDVGGNELFEDFAKRWVEETSSGKSVQTIHNYKYQFKNHIFPAFGKVSLKNISREMCSTWLFGKQNTMTEPTKQRVAQTFNAIMAEAVRQRRITENPMGTGRDSLVRRIKYKNQRAEITPVTGEQLRIIEQHLYPRWRLAFWLMYGLGLRVNEALAANRKGIINDGQDFRTMEQNLQKQYRKEANACTSALKWRDEGDYRDIPLPGWLKKKIDEHIAEFDIPDGGYLFPGVINGDRGDSYGNFWYRFREGTFKARAYGVHPHMLRHLFASTMLAGGCNPFELMKWLGHKKLETTTNIYGHMLPVARDHLYNASNRAWDAFDDIAFDEDGLIP